MSTEGDIDKATAELVSLVAQRSTLSCNAKPFIPSFLQSPPADVPSESPGGTESAGGSGACAYARVPSAESLATTTAVAAAALGTFGGMTEEELQQLEEYLWDPAQGGGGGDGADVEAGDDDRVFVNDDDGMDVEEEEWLFDQMLRVETARVAEEQKK